MAIAQIKGGLWFTRFLWAIVIQGRIAAVATILIAEPLTFFTGR